MMVHRSVITASVFSRKGLYSAKDEEVWLGPEAYGKGLEGPLVK